jgi:hypothetical protein
MAASLAAEMASAARVSMRKAMGPALGRLVTF